MVMYSLVRVLQPLLVARVEATLPGSRGSFKTNQAGLMDFGQGIKTVSARG